MPYKLSVILFSTLFAYMLSGCHVDDYQQREEILVSKLLKSQQSLYLASKQLKSDPQANTILKNHSFQSSNKKTDAILNTTLYIGDLYLSGSGYERFQLSDAYLDFDLDTQTQEYAYDYRGYLYDIYHDRYQFDTTLSFVANADQNPHKGVMQIVGAEETIIVTVLNDRDVDIRIYEHYDTYYDRVIHSSWKSLGF